VPGGGWKYLPPRLRLRGCGFLPLIRDRECRQPFRLLPPAVPLLADVVEHRFEIGESCFGQGGACAGFGKSRFTPGYASFLRTVPRAGVIRPS
jgi:hypothetical protein